MRALVISALFAAVLVLNPFFACSSSPSFAFSLEEVERALAGTWDAKVTKDGKTEQLTFRIEAASEDADKVGARDLVRPAAACGKRTLVKSAAACLDETFVPLRLVALDGSALSKGTFRVVGTRFERGQAMLELAGVELIADITSEGDVVAARAANAGAGATAELIHTK